MSQELPPTSPSRTLSKRYILALSTVALLSIAGQVGIQWSIKRQSSDAVVINVAGRQRMLSQKLTKATLAIQSTSDPNITHQYVQELEDVVNLWEKSHQGLQVGDSYLGLPGNNSVAVQKLFAEIEAPHQTMLAGAKGILTIGKTESRSPSESPNFSRFIRQILQQEAHFLQGMDAIVNQYQKEAEARVARMSQIQWLLLSITLLVLFLEAWLIFRPAVHHIHQYITELKAEKAKAAQLSDKLEQQNIELESLLEAAYSATRLKAQFVANMSHELLTPMNAVIGMTSLLAQTPLNPQQRDFLDVIRQSSNNLLQLIQDILAFSKIEAGQLQLENQPFSLRDLIEEAIEVVAPEAVNKRLEIAYEIDNLTAEKIWVDVFRLRQILLNLLTNAIKFTDRGEIIISVSAEDLGHWSIEQNNPQNESSPGSQYQEIQFSVKDTGIGIPEHKMNQLFRLFSQVDGSNIREYGGLGLGLLLSKRLSELMGGRVWVESQQEIGSTFGFSLTAQVVPNVKDSLNQVHPSLQGKRLLIVDDHQSSRKILRRQLEKWGMICVDVATGAEALESIQQGNKFDGVLLDLQMPQMDGLSLGRLIHQEKRLPHVKLVMMSAIGCPAKLPDNEFVECVTKPIKISQLYQKMINLWAPCSEIVAPKTSESQNGKRDDKEDPKKKEKLAEKLADRLPLRILLAEDNAVNQKLALRMLSGLGYTADLAQNGLEAIAALEAKPYDLILMDVQMPKMDGIEATRRICQQWTPPISKDYATEVKPWIIAITAGGINGDRAQCLAAGMDDYLNKPINLKLLQGALERLGERSNRQELTSETEMMRKSAIQMQPSSENTTTLLNESKKSITPDTSITIDLTVLEKLRQELITSEASEDSDVLGEIIDLFLEDTPSLLTAIEEALEAQDISTLQYAVHTLRGSSSNLGIQRMYHLCFQLQDLGAQGYFEEALHTFTELQTEFMRVKAALASRPEKFYEQ